jgi:hypothetical protein
MSRYGVTMLLAIHHKSSNPLISKKFNRPLTLLTESSYCMRWGLMEYFKWNDDTLIQFKYYQENFHITYRWLPILMRGQLPTVDVTMNFPEQYSYTSVHIYGFPDRIQASNDPRLQEIIEDYFVETVSTANLYALIKTSLKWFIVNVPKWYHTMNCGFKIPFDEEKHRFRQIDGGWIAKDPQLKQLIAISEAKSMRYRAYE